jgi:ABC-type transport system involved in multi-copper enzyme maturation permease subunit
MGALLRKELREHRWVLLALLLLLALGQAVILRAAGMMGSPMVAYQKVVVIMAPLMALVLANRLVVREYMGRTQLFLETLPVSRTQVLATKWLLGGALLLLALGACLGAALFFARGKVTLTPHYVALVAIRSASFVLFSYALAFAVGLTGRYRYVIWSVLLVLMLTADALGQVDVADWPPFYLVRESMVYERLALPLSAVLTTCGIAAGLVAATFALALSAEGSLVVALSRRMRSREKSAVTIGFLALILVFTVIETRKPKPPFELARAVRSEGGPAVAVGAAGPEGVAQQLANALSSDLARMQAFLALSSPPALTALPDDALDGDAFQRAVLPNADGVVVRAAFTNSAFDSEGFRAYALASWMQWYSRGRAAEESRRWLLDGTAQWLVARDLPQQQEKLALRAAFAARLLEARPDSARRAVHAWLSVREELGSCLADALAWRMVTSLAQQMGEPRFQALSRSVLAERPPGDARASLFAPGFATLLAQAGAPDQAMLARQFDKLLDAERARLAGTLDRIAVPQAGFTAQRMAGKTFEVHYRMGPAAGDVPPFSVLYVALGPWDGEIPPEALARVDSTRAGAAGLVHARHAPVHRGGAARTAARLQRQAGGAALGGEMNGVLFRKELRSLRPFLFVMLALLLMDVVDVLLVPFGARPFPDRLRAMSDELGIMQIVLGFAMGVNLLVREIDEGTLNFLDGLPVRRGAIFAAKFNAAMLVLLIFPVGALLLNACLHAATRDSLNHALHPSLLLTMFALCCLATAVALTAGMLLGFLRYVAWLVLALCAIGVRLLQDAAPSTAAVLNTADLLSLRFTGTAWQLPMATIWTQLGAALLFGAMAFALFCSAGRIQARVQRIGAPRRWLRRFGIALMVAAALAGMSRVVERIKEGKDGSTADAGERADALEFTPIAGAHAATRHYSFSYPALSSGRVRPLIDKADATFDAVAALLGIDGGAPIDVDLSGTTENHAGTAYLDRIRMRVNDKDARAVLAHETAHVFAERLAGGARARELQKMMVLNEGLAAWVENKLDTQTGVNRAQERAAAIVSARRLLAPRQLTDQAAFVGAVDENLKYPLGAILVDRLVNRYGAAAPKTLLQVLGRADFPRDLEGYALWQTAFQLARFDLDLVLDDYARHLKGLEATYAREIAQLPRPRGSLVEQEDEDEDWEYAIALRFDLPVPEEASPLVRYRPGKTADSSSYRIRYAERSEAGKYTATVPMNIITRDEVCFQPGVVVDALVMYEPWVCLPVDSASGD